HLAKHVVMPPEEKLQAGEVARKSIAVRDDGADQQLGTDGEAPRQIGVMTEQTELNLRADRLTGPEHGFGAIEKSERERPAQKAPQSRGHQLGGKAGRLITFLLRQAVGEATQRNPDRGAKVYRKRIAIGMAVKLHH